MVKPACFFLSLLFLQGIAQATTWDEPEDPEALARADLVVTASLIRFNALAARFKVIEVVAGQNDRLKTGAEFPVSGYYLLNLSSISAGSSHGGFEDYESGSVYVLFLKRAGPFEGDLTQVQGIIESGEAVYQLPTPTICRIQLKEEKAQRGHLWWSFYRGSPPAKKYLACLASLWKVAHGQRPDHNLARMAAGRLLVLPLESKQESEVSEQAMWLDYLAIVGGGKLETFVLPYRNSPYLPIRLSAIRALGRCGNTETPKILGGMVKEAKAEPIIQTFAIQSLSTLKAKEELIGLQDLLGSLSDEPLSFATNLMDPRRNSVLSPRQALLEALKQFGITPKIETQHPQTAKPVEKKGITQANSTDKGRKTVTVCDFGSEPVKEQSGGGYALDKLGDAKADSHFFLDLYGVRLSAESKGDIDLDMNFTPPPEMTSVPIDLLGGSIDARYRILFDTDRNAQTGSIIEGFPGIQREVEIIVRGIQPGPDPFTVSGFIINTLDGSKTPFSAISSLSAEASWNTLSTGQTSPLFGMRVSIRGIPRRLLSLVADEVPVTVISQNEAGVADTTVFIFDQKAWEKEPDLRISSAVVREPMRFAVKGLTPGKEFTISIDDMGTGTPVFTGHAGPGGISSGSFILPALSPGGHSLYVEEKRAPDEQFRWGFNVTTCEECYAEYVKTPIAEEAYPGEAYVKYSKGSDLQDEKRPEEATSFLEEAYRLDPNSRRIIGRLAQAYSATGKHPQANSLLEELRRKFVKPSGGVSERLAYAYTIMRRYQEAIDILEDLIQKSDGTSEYAWDLLAHACRESKEWMRLLKIAKFGIEKDPHSAPAYHEAGFAASMIYGLHSEESRRYYAKYRELEPDKQKSAFVKEIFPDL